MVTRTKNAFNVSDHSDNYIITYTLNDFHYFFCDLPHSSATDIEFYSFAYSTAFEFIENRIQEKQYKIHDAKQLLARHSVTLTAKKKSSKQAKVVILQKRYYRDSCY